MFFYDSISSIINYRLTYFEVNSGVYNEIHLSNEERFNKEKLGLFKYENQLFSVSLDKKRIL